MKRRTYQVYVIALNGQHTLKCTINNVIEVGLKADCGVYIISENNGEPNSPYSKDYKHHYFPIATTILKEM